MKTQAIINAIRASQRFQVIASIALDDVPSDADAYPKDIPLTGDMFLMFEASNELMDALRRMRG